MAWREPLALPYELIRTRAAATGRALTVAVMGSPSCSADGACASAGVYWSIS
jgi:hypothetical protein